jgi:signal transduction histidine kinase
VLIGSFGDNIPPEYWDGRIRELALSTLYAYEEAQLFDSEKMVCAPLSYNNERLGALVLMYERGEETFQANEVNLLNALTNNTAMFIYAARLLDKLAQRNADLEKTLQELKTTQDKLSRAERLSLIGQTMSGLVHDMKNPLNIVMGYSGMLQEYEVTSEERKMYAGEIIKYVNVFSSMMEEILDYTRGDESVQKSPVVLDEYMAKINNLLNPPGLDRGVKITVNAAAAQGRQVNIDSQRFARVFQNLVNNAVDAIENKGGSQVQIDVEPQGGDQIRFMVTDDGPGVPENIVSTIFEPFVTHGKPRGTGLGLAIVDRMVSIHGGKISYEPGPNGGARFVFTLPQYKESSGEAAPKNDTSSAKSEALPVS